LRELLELHTANEEITARTPYLARVQCSNLLYHVLQSMESSAKQERTQGALTNPEDHLLILVGHDTNLANISGALNLSWLIDGRLNDTPPGGALIFELWKKRSTAQYSVRVLYTAQTLNQMRNSTPLNIANPPERVPVFVPGCGQADGSCDWHAFQQTVRESIDQTFVR
jgi:4-phytase / acid phosphatase